MTTSILGWLVIGKQTESSLCKRTRRSWPLFLFFFLFWFQDFATIHSTATRGRLLSLSALFAFLTWFDFGVQVHLSASNTVMDTIPDGLRYRVSLALGHSTKTCSKACLEAGQRVSLIQRDSVRSSDTLRILTPRGFGPYFMAAPVSITVDSHTAWVSW